MAAIIASVIGISQILVASEDNNHATVIDTGTFEKWVLVDFELRKESDKYVRIEDNTINISDKSSIKNIWVFNPVSIPCTNGENVEFSFNAKGMGYGQIGFLAYEDDKWTATDGMGIMNFSVEENMESFKFNLPVKGGKIKAIRVLIGATPNSDVKFSYLKISLK